MEQTEKKTTEQMETVSTTESTSVEATKKPRSAKQIQWAKELGKKSKLLKQQKETAVVPTVQPTVQPMVLPVILVVGFVGIIGYWYYNRKPTIRVDTEITKPEPVLSASPLMN